MNTDALISDLRSDEGWRAHPYEDSRPEKYLTIGYGFLIDPRRGGGLPRPVAEFWLRYLVNEKLDELRKAWPAFDDQPADVQQALGNMAYQLGVPGLMKFKRLLAALAAGDRATAAEEAEESAWFTQTPNRAQRVIGLLRGS